MNKKLLIILVLTFVLLIVFNIDLDAQCPMCRMSAETNLRNGGTEGKGLNRGILYMLCLPYLLVGTLGFIWWKNKKKFSDHILEEPFSDN
jgi:hypothetical protein